MSNDAQEFSEKRSNSRSHTSRPTTPLRPSSRSSFRESARGASGNDAPFPLNVFEPAFAELSDAMADLEANMMHFQLMHESLARFSESFASFLYGLNMNAFCVDFPEAPVAESFKRDRAHESHQRRSSLPRPEVDPEATFMTTDTSFVENPSTATRTPNKTPGPSAQQSRPTVNRGPSTRGRGIPRGRGRASGLPRGRGVK